MLQDCFTTVVYSSFLTCDRVLAVVALLGHISLVAVHAVNVVLMGSEASSCQRFAAGVAHEALGVPGLVLVADSSRSDGLRGTRRDTLIRTGRSFILLKML